MGVVGGRPLEESKGGSGVVGWGLSSVVWGQGLRAESRATAKEEAGQPGDGERGRATPTTLTPPSLEGLLSRCD